MKTSHRTPFLDSAEAPNASRLQRFERFVFRQRPLNHQPPFAAQADDPRLFQPTEEGSGNFGRWIVDEAGLPAYQYEMDQYVDPRAAFPNSEGLDRRDHWHQVGNQRVTALASNDGTVQVYQCDRGGVFLNRFEAWEYDRPAFQAQQFLYRLLRSIILFLTSLFRRPNSVVTPLASPEAQAARAAVNPNVPPRGISSLDALTQLAAINAQAAPEAAAKSDPAAQRYAFSGGFSYVDDGSEVWATAFRYRPTGAQTRRVFGIGYFEHQTTHRSLRMTRRVYAPYGDDPTLIADVEIENLGTEAVNLRHYEYWDVNVHQLQLEWLRSGSFAATSDKTRREVNRLFAKSVEWNEGTSALRFRQTLRQPAPPQACPPEQASEVDWHPADIFLADLNGTPDAFYINKQVFFGAGGARQPDAVRTRRAGDDAGVPVPDDPMPYCLVMRRDLTLQPGERQKLRYAYGSARAGESLGFLEPYRQQADGLRLTQTAWKDQLAYFSTGEDPVLQREMAWHAYALLSAVVYADFYKAHLVPQGSAYLYLHGADGAPRDQALFALPATYLDPPLARDMLRLIMQVTSGESGQINYAFAGHGWVSDGLSIHTKPSDLDLFFLMALCEYLSATGDYDFLDEAVPFYPPEASPEGATVMDHVHKAVWHLLEVTGTGDHGLIKVGSGDWSDSIVLETSLRDGPGPFGVTYNNSKANGESVPNTQMALYVLPLLAAVLKDRDPQLVDLIYDAPAQPNRIERLRQAVRQQWNGQGWYNRAVLRNVLNQPVSIDHFSLEAQPWALISGAADDHEVAGQLIEKIDQLLDRPSPIGGTLVAGGMVWPAVSQLLTWGYAQANRPQLAWRSLNRNTYAMHSHTYPNQWINTWSGPDGINGLESDLPGGTWFSPITPMTDFPVMNANQDAMALLGLLRVCGIEPAPTGDGLVIHPRVPRERFVLDLPLLRLEVSPSGVRLSYRAVVAGSRTLYIHHQLGAVTVTVDDVELSSVEPSANPVVVPIAFEAGQVVRVNLTAR